jgi:hypothetical protein
MKVGRVVLLSLSLGLAVLAVTWARPRLARVVQVVKVRSDVYSLPPPPVLGRASLGYRSALADYLWAHVLVTQGLRMGEKRPFSEVALYLDVINYLDPDFREPYRLADSIMSFQIGDPDRVESVRQARIVLERGLVQFPYDAELWLNYGQFLAYIAPGSLPVDAEEKTDWQEAGARALVRAGELGGDGATLYKAMSAAAILNRQGEVEAAIQFLERLYAVADDEEVREDVGRRLQALRQGRQESRDFELSQAFDSVWRDDLPFAPRAMLSVLGPPYNAWECAGRPSRNFCKKDWRSWSDRIPLGSGARPP